ncbi:MAG: NAD(P)/FAD-dependent oxidoreductase [Candidatus Omnitrophica bacterium]|nr:NAD(P)/FAD-dependent oxidoreductase [Candidatus Omnitrophota bacterium]
MEKIDITIVGAGVIGLAIASELSKTHKDIIVIERNYAFGQETSSRNSEVIHAGIYYPKDSLKAKTCIEGKNLLYEYCVKNNINHRMLGKLIVAANVSEILDLEVLYKNALNNGLNDLRLISKSEIEKIEPNIKAEAAIHSPSTGIIDSHGLMKSLVDEFASRKGQIAYNTELTAIEKSNSGYKVTVEDKSEGAFSFSTKVFINSAGLNSDKIAKMVGIEEDEYRLKYCKGDYFRTSNKKGKLVNRLVYPVPKNKGAGLGIHATLDLGGSLRLGPDDEYVQDLDYNIDGTKQRLFYDSVKHFLPFIEYDDLAKDMAGIRPKLQGQDEDFRDFLIKEESDKGLPGFVNLIGIESPGLTSALSIAKLVKKIVKGGDK